MKKTIKSILLIGALTMGAGAVTSCSDDDDSYMSRLFRPVVSSDNIVTGIDADMKSYITFSWDDYADANQYAITLSTEDGTTSLTKNVEGSEVTFTDLQYDINYNIAIKAMNTLNGLESKDYKFSVRSADYPTRLKAIETTDIIDVGARIKWDNTDGDANYDSLQIVQTSNDSIVHTYALTEQDKANAEKIVSGLKATTNYQVKAYIAGAYQGKRSFKTTASEDYGSDVVIDMRKVDENDIYKCLSISSESSFDGLLDSLIATYPDQNITIVLPGGADVRMATMKLKATTGRIKLTTGLTLAGNANVCVAGNFDVTAGMAVGGVEFDKLNFTEAPLDGKNKGDSNFGGTYLFNFDGKDATIGSVKISNCNIKYKRGVCRIKNAVAIGSFTIDNCVVDSIGGYGIVNCDANNSTVDNVTVTNCTFSNCEKFIVVSSSKSGNIINNVQVANCTFVYCIADSKPFVDMKDRELQTYTLTNCLFGAPGPLNKDAVANGITGFSGSIAPTCNDCYFASDFLWQKDATTGEVKAALSGTTLKATTQELFKSPLTSDFTIIAKEANGVGDPRWY